MERLLPRGCRSHSSHRVAGGPPLGQVTVITPLGIDQTGGNTSKTPMLSYNLHFTFDALLCWEKQQGSSCGCVYPINSLISFGGEWKKTQNFLY